MAAGDGQASLVRQPLQIMPSRPSGRVGGAGDGWGLGLCLADAECPYKNKQRTRYAFFYNSFVLFN